jgi:hypothetical protein
MPHRQNFRGGDVRWRAGTAPWLQGKRVPSDGLKLFYAPRRPSGLGQGPSFATVLRARFYSTSFAMQLLSLGGPSRILKQGISPTGGLGL